MNASTRCVFISAAILLFLSTLAFIINFTVYHYPGNNYFPPGIILIGSSLILMYWGFCLQNGRESSIAVIIKEVIYFLFVMSVLTYATNAAQYTPFYPIDKQLVSLESILHIDMGKIIAWTHSHPLFHQLLVAIYDTLPLQMCLLPLLVIASKRFRLIRHYYCLLLISGLAGFTFYYFFPTTAPASIISSPYFNEAQQATGLKFQQLHHHTPPTTLEGGMVALPSFHVIWAWFCLYLIKDWPIAFMILLPINLLLAASCVLLGWHYPIDLVGSLIVILLAHGSYYCFQAKIFLGIPVGKRNS